MKWVVLDNPDEVAREACKRIVQIAADCIENKGSFSIVLAGGQTPAKTYALLANEDCEWSKWHIWFGDERCLSTDDDERNSILAERTLTSKVPIPAGQVHVIPAELGPDEATEKYAKALDNQPPFDLVLLGMGEDGHTASLFPGNTYTGDEKVVAVYNAPKAPPQRVSLSYSSLRNCHNLMFLITGKSKITAINEWKSGVNLPVAQITSMKETEVLVDRDAVSTPEEGM